jgi:hyperosmotically inducible protein
MNYRSLIAIVVLILAGATWFAADGKDPITDDSIIDAVRRKLTNDPIVKGGAFEVESKAGVVTLRGKVEQEKQRERAARITQKVKGVKSVDNQLTVATKGPR